MSAVYSGQDSPGDWSVFGLAVSDYSYSPDHCIKFNREGTLIYKSLMYAILVMRQLKLSSVDITKSFI